MVFKYFILLFFLLNLAINAHSFKDEFCDDNVPVEKKHLHPLQQRDAFKIMVNQLPRILKTNRLCWCSVKNITRDLFDREYGETVEVFFPDSDYTRCAFIGTQAIIENLLAQLFILGYKVEAYFTTPRPLTPLYFETPEAFKLFFKEKGLPLSKASLAVSASRVNTLRRLLNHSDRIINYFHTNQTELFSEKEQIAYNKTLEEFKNLNAVLLPYPAEGEKSIACYRVKSADGRMHFTIIFENYQLMQETSDPTWSVRIF